MKRVEHSQAYLRKRRLLSVLPLLFIPFLTLLFWATGGRRVQATEERKLSGLNLNLPAAALKDEKGMDKLSFYDLAQKDSTRLAEKAKNDPYRGKEDRVHDPSFGSTDEIERLTGQTASKFKVNAGLQTSPYGNFKTKPEDDVMQKLAALQKQLDKPTVAKKDDGATDKSKASESSDAFSSQVDRLEGMMQAMNGGTETDPEMQQLQTTLDKMLDVQHPERVRERLKEQSVKNKRSMFPVVRRPFQPSVSLLDTSRKKPQATITFYSLDASPSVSDPNAVEAVVDQSQTLVNGAVLKLRLLNDVFINGVLIPNGSFVVGTVSLNGERLEVKIESIRHMNNLLPVQLEAYDMDGLPGIYIPGAITRDVAKSSAENAAQLLEISSLDPSLKAQATNAGLSAVKSLLTKKAKLVKVTVKDGYKVLLKDRNAEQ